MSDSGSEQSKIFHIAGGVKTGFDPSAFRDIPKQHKEVSSGKQSLADHITGSIKTSDDIHDFADILKQHAKTSDGEWDDSVIHAKNNLDDLDDPTGSRSQNDLQQKLHFVRLFGGPARQEAGLTARLGNPEAFGHILSEMVHPLVSAIHPDSPRGALLARELLKRFPTGNTIAETPTRLPIGQWPLSSSEELSQANKHIIEHPFFNGKEGKLPSWPDYLKMMVPAFASVAALHDRIKMTPREYTESQSQGYRTYGSTTPFLAHKLSQIGNDILDPRVMAKKVEEQWNNSSIVSDIESQTKATEQGKKIREDLPSMPLALHDLQFILDGHKNDHPFGADHPDKKYITGLIQAKDWDTVAHYLMAKQPKKGTNLDLDTLSLFGADDEGKERAVREGKTIEGLEVPPKWRSDFFGRFIPAKDQLSDLGFSAATRFTGDNPTDQNAASQAFQTLTRGFQYDGRALEQGDQDDMLRAISAFNYLGMIDPSHHQFTSKDEGFTVLRSELERQGLSPKVVRGEIDGVENGLNLIGLQLAAMSHVAPRTRQDNQTLSGTKPRSNILTFKALPESLAPIMARHMLGPDGIYARIFGGSYLKYGLRQAKGGDATAFDKSAEKGIVRRIIALTGSDSVYHTASGLTPSQLEHPITERKQLSPLVPFFPRDGSSLGSDVADKFEAGTLRVKDLLSVLALAPEKKQSELFRSMGL